MLSQGKNVFLIHLICSLHKKISHIWSITSVLWNYILPTYNNILLDSYFFQRWLIGYKFNPFIGNGYRWFGFCWLAIMQHMKLSGTTLSIIYDGLLLHLAAWLVTHFRYVWRNMVLFQSLHMIKWFTNFPIMFRSCQFACLQNICWYNVA